MKRNERIAHDLICIIKYGSIGGSVSTNEISRLVSHMESTGLVQREVPKVTIPKVTFAAPKISLEAVCAEFKVQVPSIRLP